jgi:hypothetical protein
MGRPRSDLVDALLLSFLRRELEAISEDPEGFLARAESGRVSESPAADALLLDAAEEFHALRAFRKDSPSPEGAVLLAEPAAAGWLSVRLFGRGVYVLGRSPKRAEVDLVIPHLGLEEQHALLSVGEASWLLDLGGPINGERNGQKRRVENGAEIGLGSLKAIFLLFKAAR